ncbi:MAG TPA: histidine phosphatase family protein [Anaeromyxobacter sp.]
MIYSAVPDSVTRLLLVRHGETEARARGIIAGRLDVPLSRRGREQARAVGASLRDVPLGAVYSSTSQRALDTACAVAKPHRLAVISDPGLREIDFGMVEGLTFDEVAARFPNVAAAWVSRPHEVAFPGGECLAAMRERVVRSVRAIVARHPSAAAALVCHAGSIRAIVGAVLGLAPEVAVRLRCECVQVTVLDVDEELRFVRSMTMLGIA